MSERKKIEQKKPLFVLHCSACGWEQVIIRRNRENYERLEELKQAKAIYCGRKVCPATHEREVPPGHIRIGLWFGSWELVRPATLEEYRSVKRARAIMEAALRQKEQSTLEERKEGKGEGILSPTDQVFKLKERRKDEYKVYKNGEPYRDSDGKPVNIFLFPRGENKFVALDEHLYPYICVFKSKSEDQWEAMISITFVEEGEVLFVEASGMSRVEALENALNQLPNWKGGRYC
jgi:hypothetical protein